MAPRKVAIVTDSCSDLPPGIAEELGITVVPALLQFGPEETWLDGQLSLPEFFAKIEEKGMIPTTSQPAAGIFAKTYAKLLAQGLDVVSIHITSQHSGIYASACLGKRLLVAEGQERVAVIDSKRVTMALGIIVCKAAEAAKKGQRRKEIVQLVNDLIPRTGLFALLNTLEYLQKGGRLGRAQALFGQILRFKPILTIDEEGLLCQAAVNRMETRTLGRAQKKLVDLIRQQAPFERIAVIHAQNLGAARDISKNFGLAPIYEIGAVLATHAGPGAVAICFLKQK